LIPYVEQEGKLIPLFHPGQRRAWESKARFVLVLAGTQGGKTSFGPWWLYREILTRGPGDYFAATSSFDLFKLKMLPALRWLFEETLRIGRYWTQMRILELADPEGKFWAKRGDDPMWARIILRSANAPEGLESGTIKAAWLDEVGQPEWTREAWEAILRRLSLYRGRCLGTTTVYGFGWLKEEWYDRWARGDPDYDVIQFASTENPAFPKEEFERARRSMPEWKFRMFYQGEFAKPENAVFQDFDPIRHVVEPFEIPSHWPIVLGIDFGGANTAVVAIAVSSEGIGYVCWEYKAGNLPAVEHVNRIRQAFRGREIFAYGGSPGETQYRLDWTMAGLAVQTPIISDVGSSILKIIELLRTDRLRFFRTCAQTIDQVQDVRWKMTPQGPDEAIAAQRFYHFVDALRYAAPAVAAGFSIQDFRVWAEKTLVETERSVPPSLRQAMDFARELDRVTFGL
jgi:hypothetical protein